MSIATPQVLLESILEKEWDSMIFASQKGLAPILGWRLCYHTLRSKGSQSGFPDRVLVRDRIIFAELKREKRVATPVSGYQREWLDGLASAGCEVYLWRPSDLDEIGVILGKRWTLEKGLDGRRILKTELATFRPASLWIPGVGRADELSQGSEREPQARLPIGESASSPAAAAGEATSRSDMSVGGTA